MTPTTTQISITITDRNETKFLRAFNLIGTPSPRDNNMLDYEFPATDEVFQARRAYALNGACPIQAYIAASKMVDKEIHEHRQKRGGL